MQVITQEYIGRTTLLTAVALGALSFATPALAGSETCTFNFDATGHETLTSDTSSSFSGSGLSQCFPAEFFSATYYSALSFNSPTTITSQATANTTEIIGTLNGTTTIDDLTFSAAFNTPSVQASIQSVINAIVAAGGTSVSGPTLISNTVTHTSASMSTYTVSGINTTAAITTTVGPAVVNSLFNVGTGVYPPVNSTTVLDTGDTSTQIYTNANQAPMLPNVYTVCTPTLSTVSGGAISTVAVGTVLTAMPTCSANNGGTFTLAGGQTDENVAQTTTFTIDTATTTTNTTTTTAVYDINGVSAVTIPPVPPTPPGGVPVPEPRSVAILALGLVALIGIRSHPRFAET